MARGAVNGAAPAKGKRRRVKGGGKGGGDSQTTVGEFDNKILTESVQKYINENIRIITRPGEISDECRKSHLDCYKPESVSVHEV